MHRTKTLLLDRAHRARRITGTVLLGLLAGGALVAAKPSIEAMPRAGVQPATMGHHEGAAPSIDVLRYSLSGNHPWDRRE
jgi:hypothetical protein